MDLGVSQMRKCTSQSRPVSGVASLQANACGCNMPLLEINATVVLHVGLSFSSLAVLAILVHIVSLAVRD